MKSGVLGADGVCMTFMKQIAGEFGDRRMKKDGARRLDAGSGEGLSAWASPFLGCPSTLSFWDRPLLGERNGKLTWGLLRQYICLVPLSAKRGLT